jgi:Concanavalin A-like lectin/glucanases superfamily/Secretion system C-terminal sorting domain
MMQFRLLFLTLLLQQGFLLAQQPNPNGLVLYYPFNGNSLNTVNDDNHATVFGPQLTTDRFGTANSAYYFDGVNDVIIVGNNVGLDNDTYSISWWAEIDELPTTGNSRVMFDLGSSPQTNSIPGQVTAVNNKYFNTVGWRTTCGNTDGSEIGFQNDVLPEKDTWYHLTLVRNADSVKFYVNCNLVLSAQTNGSQPKYNTPIELFIGSRVQSTLSQYWSGKIDDFAIYNRALSELEIQDLCFGQICRNYITVTDTLLIDIGLSGYNPVTFRNTVRIFPNPTSEFITIDAGDINEMTGYKYKIINSAGQEVVIGNFTQQQTVINISTFGGAGIYFFQLIDPNDHLVDIRKIVIQ